jgi:septal ring factor EnvC (AmiA/AmiB activator)
MSQQPPGQPPGSGPPPGPGSPPGERTAGVREEVVVDPETEPATVGEVRSLRRWLLVTGVWAVAATAIAVIALVAANDDSEDRAANRQTAGELARVQRQLNDRVDDLESRLEDAPSADDVRALDERLGKVERSAGATSDSIERATGRIDELDSQLSDLDERLTALETAEPTETTP